MVGIPYRLLRDSEDGPVEKVLYLATRRTGEGGQAMKNAKREYYAHEFGCACAAKRFQSADQAVLACAPEDDRRAALENERDAQLERIRAEGDAATDAAERLVRLSLTENYGAAAAGEIVDQLTDRDVRAMVTVIETGELPPDFFGGSDRRPRPTTTSPSGGLPAESYSNADSADDRSSGARSASRMPSC